MEAEQQVECIPPQPLIATTQTTWELRTAEASKWETILT